jgi:hypothetical protein
MKRPGMIAFIGSGETTALGGQVYDLVAQGLSHPLHIAVLETPAGFELNSAQVAGRVAEFITRRLQNKHPETTIIPARRKNTPFSPDDAGVVEPLYQAGLIFLGPGSPTYAVRQLAGSLAWDILRARHQAGAALVFASAASIAAGSHALPVYEIYKAGLDPFWAPGLDLLAPYGLHLIFIPHWDNTDGGAELDTSRCFIGQERFAALRDALPAESMIIGIDEHTALVLDLELGQAQAVGRGSVHILGPGGEKEYAPGAVFEIAELGKFIHPPADTAISATVYQRALKGGSPPVAELTTPPSDVQALAEERESARQAKNWVEADRLRQRLKQLGWAVKDTPQGTLLERLK